MSDLISRADAISSIEKTIKANSSIHYEMKYWEDGMNCAKNIVEDLPPAEPTLYGYDIKFLSSIAAVMAKNRISTVEAVKIFSDFKRTVDFVLEEQQKEIDKFLKVHFLKGEENGTDK